MMSCPSAPGSILAPKDPRDRFRRPSPALQPTRSTLDQPGALERVDEALTQSQQKAPGGMRSPYAYPGRTAMPIAIKGRSNSAHDWERPMPAMLYGGPPLERWPSGGQTAASVVSSYRPGILRSEEGSFRVGPPPSLLDGLLPGDTTPNPATRRASYDGHGRSGASTARPYSANPSRPPSTDRHCRTLQWAYSTQALVLPYETTSGSPPLVGDLGERFVPSSGAVSPLDLGMPAQAELQLWDDQAQPGGYGAVNGGQEVFFDLSEDGSEEGDAASFEVRPDTPPPQS